MALPVPEFGEDEGALILPTIGHDEPFRRIVKKLSMYFSHTII
jgi:hypothetical protein